MTGASSEKTRSHQVAPVLFRSISKSGMRRCSGERALGVLSNPLVLRESVKRIAQTQKCCFRVQTQYAECNPARSGAVGPPKCCFRVQTQCMECASGGGISTMLFSGTTVVCGMVSQAMGATEKEIAPSLPSINNDGCDRVRPRLFGDRVALRVRFFALSQHHENIISTCDV